MTAPLAVFTGSVIYLDTMLPYMLLREEILAEFAPAVVVLLRRLRELPHLTLLDVSVSDLETMNEAMGRHRLRPRDGLHLAAMQQISCLDLASTDPHFDRVPHIRRFTL